MELYKILISLIVLFYNCANCANILGVFYFPYLNHYKLGHSLMKELAKRGHNVTMLSSYVNDEPIVNYTYVSTEELLKLGEEFINKTATAHRNVRTRVTFNIFLNICNDTINNKNVRRLLKEDNKFDLIIYDSPATDILLGLTYRFNVPAILFNPLGDMATFNKYTGRYIPLSYISNGDMFDFETFTGRLKNTVKSLIKDTFITLYYDKLLNEIHHKYLPDAPSLDELYENIALTLSNSHYTYETPRPYTPNVIQIGGFYLNNREVIVDDLKKWLDDATEGVVLVSYSIGIQKYALDNDKIEIFLNVFGMLKQKVLCKFDVNKTEMITFSKQIPNNIRFENRIPQKEVLNHPNVKVFITHGDIISITEAIYGGVPIIGTPFFFDPERYVINTVLNFGYGIEMNFESLSKSTLEDAINEVLNNMTYTQNIKKASIAFKNQPICPMEKAMYWIEHVIKYNRTNHLIPSSIRLDSYQHHLLDVIIFLISICSLVLYISYYVVRRLFRYVFCKNK